MTTQEILDKIARYKDAMESETDDDAKKKFQSRIETLEKQIAQAEVAVEKKEEQIEKKEDKALEEAEKKLQRYKDAIEGETDPDTIAKFKKRISDLEAQLKGVKEQIKEEKKEIEEQKKDLKEAVKEVKSAQKAVRTQAIKKAGKQAAARTSIGTSKKKRTKKITDIISKLDKLIEKSPALKSKYEGARGGSYMQYKKVDLKRDAGRASKPFGYRFKGDSTKVPKPSQRGQANVYYENRANRSDVFPKRKFKLAKGGMTEMGQRGKNKIKDWYVETYPTDDMGPRINDKITFKGLWADVSKGHDVYEVLGVYDSVIRERVFVELAEILGVDYDVVYTKWRKSASDINPLPRWLVTTTKEKMADGGTTKGKHYVGRFTEAQLKNKEDKKAVEKAQKETGLKYVDTKMVRKAGKIVAMDVYLIDEETYLKQPLFADGGMAGGGEKMADGGMMDKGGKTIVFQTPYIADSKLKHKGKIVEDKGKYVVVEVENDPFLLGGEKGKVEVKKEMILSPADGESKGGNLKRHKMYTGGVVLNVYDSGTDWKINVPSVQREFDDFKSAKRAGEKADAFQYEILDEITGDVMFTTHSEKMTPSLTYKKGGETKKSKSKSAEKKKSGRRKHEYSWKPSAKGNVPEAALNRKETSNQLWRYYMTRYPQHIEKKEK